MWVVEGGKITPVELPPDGWTLEYDKPTGFPNRTSQKRKEAEKVFGDDTSYFYATRSGVRAVLRGFYIGDSGRFYVCAFCQPDDRSSGVGVRLSSRSEQDAKHLATPVYVMAEPDYKVLERVAEGNPEIAEILPRIQLQK
jgi:hypothetical protein